MSRYIDADNFRKAMIKRFGCIPCLTDYSEASRYDIPIDDALKLAPTADVAPRAEVAEELINMALSKIQIMISAIKAQEGNGIITEFNGGAKTALEIVFKDLAELKKKYTEEK